MTFESKLYKSVNIDPYILSQIIEDYQEGDAYRYFLIDDKLVPESLVKRLHSHLCDFTFDYGLTFPMKELLGHEFWSSLDEYEKSVIGACMMIVIENGYAIPVPDELKIQH